MIKRFIVIGTTAAALGFAQVPPAPNTIPKPVNDPTNTSNITGDPTVPGTTGTLPSGNPGLATNPTADLSDQARQAADQTFATNLTLQDLTGIELGKLVAKSSSNGAVKAYATQVIENNSKMIGTAQADRFPRPNYDTSGFGRASSRPRRQIGETFRRRV